MRVWPVLTIALGFGCSGEEHPIGVEPYPDRGGTTGTGGTTGEGGEATGGSTSGSGGTGGTGGSGGLRNPDPGVVYLLGTLDPSQPLPVLCDLREPDTYAVGFVGGHDVYKTIIGARGMYYQIQFELAVHRWGADLVTDVPADQLVYPTDPGENDPVVVNLACPASSPLDFHVGPTDRVVYRCGNEGWFERGTLLHDGIENMLGLGNGNLAVMEEDGSYFVTDLGSGERNPLNGITGIYAVRAADTGFLVAGFNGSTTGLWEVAADGSADLVGRYPALPAGVNTPQEYELDANNDLFEIDYADETLLTQVIVRRSLDGDREIVHDERENPKVWIGHLALVSGY